MNLRRAINSYRFPPSQPVGIAPICCSSPSLSRSTHCSAILLFSTKNQSSASKFTCAPDARTPLKTPVECR